MGFSLSLAGAVAGSAFIAAATQLWAGSASQQHIADKACPSVPGNDNVSPSVIHQPAAKERTDVVLKADRPLRLDFSPFDGEGFRHDGDLTLIFENDGVVVFRHVTTAGRPTTMRIHLPDGSVITPCDLLIAFPSAPQAENGKLWNEKIPQDLKTN
jgi:hypothetical protein